MLNLSLFAIWIFIEPLCLVFNIWLLRILLVLVLWICIVLWMCVLDSRVDDIGTIRFLPNHRVSGESYID